MSEATGDTQSSIEVTLRRLRAPPEALIEAKGRGPYAAQMTFQDASRLLIAVCGSTPLEANSAKQAVKRFESLRCTAQGTTSAKGYSRGREEQKLMPLAQFPEDHSFGAALETLLVIASDQKLFLPRSGKSELTDSQLINSNIVLGFVEVRFYRPLPAALIQYQLGGYFRQTWSYGLSIGDDGERYIGIVKEKGAGGKTVVTTIDQDVLWKVGGAIVGNFEPAAY